MNLLLFRAESRICAIPVEYVEEIMRPLPIEPIPETPAFVIGASVIRGIPTPVIDLGALLSGRHLKRGYRVVSIKATEVRRVGLLVTEVMGLMPRTTFELDGVSPLLVRADVSVIEALGRLDESLLSVLRNGNLVPEDTWGRLSKKPA
jgi:purine-binding chemotaxis protein CheW